MTTAATHTIIASNALTNVILAELPVTDVHHSRLLNDSGTFDATVPVDDPGVRALALVLNNYVEPGQIAIYCRRAQTYEWGGLLWSHSYDSKTALLKLTAYEFGSYSAARYIIEAYNYSGSAIDVSVLASLWNTTVFGDGGPPLTTAVTNTGVTTVATFHPWEAHNVLDLLKGYQALSPGGIDWAFDVVLDGNGNPSAQLTISYPRRGVAFSASGVVWDYPGDVLSFSLTRSADPSLFTTELFVTGAGSGSAQLSSDAVVTAPGYIKLQHVISNPNLVTQAAVNAYATGAAKARANSPQSLVNLTVLGDVFFNSGLSTGDELTVSISSADPYKSAQWQLPGRILGYDVIPQSANSPETVVVNLGAPLVL